MSKVTRAEYYEKAFERLEKENKHTWNWAAFFFGAGWLFYRKSYLYAIVCSVFAAILSRCSDLFENMFCKFMPLLIIGLCLGYFGNYLYYRSVKKRISKGYHLLEKYSPTSVASVVLTIISSGIICFADYISRKLQLKNCVDKNITVDEDSIRKYLNPNRKKHWIVNTANTLIFTLWLLCISIVIIGTVARHVQQKLAEQQVATTQVITQQSDADSL